MNLRVAVIGAGIGGLTAAATLLSRGAAVEVYEQASELTEIGAGISLFANGQCVLDELGVLDGLGDIAGEPSNVVIRDGQSGSGIASHPLGQGGWYRAQTSFSYLGVHRAELLERLAAAVDRRHVHLEHRLVGLDLTETDVELRWEHGGAARFDVVIGADGARSTVRRWMYGDECAIYTGNSGFRGIIDARSAPSLKNPGDLQFWVGRRAHLLHFPISPGGGRITFLAAVEEPAQWSSNDTWRVPTTTEEALSYFEGWHPAVTEIIGSVPHSERWGLFRMEPIPTWRRGRVVLLGDAAHTMLPHHGQGANLSIEDAYVLARLLTAEGGDAIEDRLQQYELLRKRRTEKVQRASWRANHLLHFPDGADIEERDTAFANIPDDVRWIHTYDARIAAGESLVVPQEMD